MRRIHSFFVLVVVLSALSALATLASCGGGGGARYRLVGAPGVVTLTNLHPDARRFRLYSTNFQQDGLIPVCTPVVIESMNRKQMVFTVAGASERYTYVYDRRNATETFEENLDRYFGTDCKREYFTEMSELDQQGIREGKILPGMTRNAVIIAAGYPPPHASDLRGDVWKYWTSRFGTFDVVFAAGVVAEVRE